MQISDKRLFGNFFFLNKIKKKKSLFLVLTPTHLPFAVKLKKYLIGYIMAIIKDYEYHFCTPPKYLPTQVKGFEGELKQVLDKAVSTFSFSMVVRVPNFHFFSGQVSDEGLQKMKLLKKKDKKIFIWLQDTSLKYIFIDCFLSCHLLEPLCFFKMCQMSKL